MNIEKSNKVTILVGIIYWVLFSALPYAGMSVENKTTGMILWGVYILLSIIWVVSLFVKPDTAPEKPLEK